MTQLQSNAATLGIKLNMRPKPFDEVTAPAGGNCVVTKTPCRLGHGELGRRLVVRS